MNIRVITGLSLALVISLCLYFEYTFIVFVGINLALFYDIYSLWQSLVNKYVVASIAIFMLAFNTYLFYAYDENSYRIVKTITIVQLSDVYQYIAGTKFGRNKIGWISEKKTYEGYLIGFLLTFMTFIYVNTLWEIVLMYVLGVIGGLCSSFIKRKVQIKDYSDLLGAHGGWIDRIDSIVLPLIFC